MAAGMRVVGKASVGVRTGGPAKLRPVLRLRKIGAVVRKIGAVSVISYDQLEYLKGTVQCHGQCRQGRGG